MNEKFTHAYALLIGVGESAYSKLSLPVTVKDTQAIYAALIDPELCAYPDDQDHIRVLNNEYATKTSVLTLILPIIKSTEISGSLKRPPVYIFAWGEQYMKCVVTSISYELTMFLSDGTPVRAKVSIDLQEVDDI